jgi:hypothetical protein
MKQFKSVVINETAPAPKQRIEAKQATSTIVKANKGLALR